MSRTPSPSGGRPAAASLAILLLLLAAPLGVCAQDPAPSLSGDWIFTVVTENGTGTPAVRLVQEGDHLTGTYTSDRLGSRGLQGSVQGDTVTFRLAADPSADVTMTFVGVIQADGSLEGHVDFGGMGHATFTAQRRPPPPGPGTGA
jgi:hypothetical protein